jgi:2-keto-4-pentenoate hydratase/2-oxohepta-3-ene-1,7-dioic acid hydratase in catechol pathway
LEKKLMRKEIVTGRPKWADWHRWFAWRPVWMTVERRQIGDERGGQWDKGKSCETFNPCGPWLATADELGDILELDMWLDVNGVRRQTGSTSTMIFDPFFIVHYLSQFMVLEPGDLISTGTPPGVGMGMKPPTYLMAGDVMELGIQGLGSQRQDVIDAP